MSVTAIIRDRGLQHTIRKGDTLQVNRMPDKVGAKITLKEVLSLETDKDVKWGNPTVKGAQVSCEIMAHTRGKKLIIFKIKRRKNYRRKNGHRQELTLLRERLPR